MLASGCSWDIGAGWPGVIRRALSVVYSSASDVKSFRVCFRYRIDLVEFIPGPPLPLGMVSMRQVSLFPLFLQCDGALVVAAHRVVMDTLLLRLGLTWGSTFLISGTIPQAHLLLMSLT